MHILNYILNRKLSSEQENQEKLQQNLIPNLTVIPKEIFLDIFKCLEYKDLNKIREVCYQWKSIIEHGKKVLPLYLVSNRVYFKCHGDFEIGKWSTKRNGMAEPILDIISNLHICVLEDFFVNFDMKNYYVNFHLKKY